jgi:cell division protein FtsQ
MNPAAATPLDIKLMNMTTLVLGVVFIVLCAVALARGISLSPVFNIQGISVSGEFNHNNAVTLRANVAPRLSGTFFTVDLARVRTVFESLPWVRRAVVRRDFPNRLRVELQEHQSVAYWGGEGEVRLINSYGEVFEANVGEVEQDNLPKLSGPDGQAAEVLAMYRTIAPLFEKADLPVDQLDLSNGGSWRLQLDSGATIEMGRGNVNDVSARVNRFLKTLTQVTSRYGRQASAIEAADLRHENGYAIRLRGVSTVTADGPTKQ